MSVTRITIAYDKIIYSRMIIRQIYGNDAHLHQKKTFKAILPGCQYIFGGFL